MKPSIFDEVKDYKFKELLPLLEKCGSLFYIGYIICDKELAPNTSILGSCLGCNRCVAECPAALSGKTLDSNHTSASQADAP